MGCPGTRDKEGSGGLSHKIGGRNLLDFARIVPRRPPRLRHFMHAFARLVLATLLAALAASPTPVRAQDGVVHAVFFYSPTCPHCHDVINNDLPPLRERFGDRLVLVGVDVSTQGGGALYQATVDHFALPDSRLGVPALVVGLTVLVGSYEIPQQFPGIIERGLATGGIDWPPVTAIRQVLETQGLLRDQRTDRQARGDAPRDTTRPAADTASPAPGEERRAANPADTVAVEAEVRAEPAPGTERAAPDAADAAELRDTPDVPDTGITATLAVDSAFTFTPLTPRERFLLDPVGNGVAVATLLLLLVALGASIRTALARPPDPLRLPAWSVPVLSAVGIGVAAYLSFVEVTGAEAVCGPVGDCNTVQQSDWAMLFGVLPIGVLGLAGYAALLAAWGVARWGSVATRLPAWTAFWAMAWMGTAFSAYLTFLEPFVIGATCAWCVTSALVMALLLVAATGEMTAAANGASNAPGPRTPPA